MAELVFRGMTTRNLYRCMSGAPFPGVVVFDQNGQILNRISINGETAVFCQGIRDGSVPRGTAGPMFQEANNSPVFPSASPGPIDPTWAPSQWEQP